jgi:ankyrin repeat protein
MISYTIDDLLYEIQEGNIDEVKTLLDQGVDINAKDNIGWFPLLLAYKKNKVEIMKLLLDKGANTEITFKPYGFTILADAIHNYKDTMAKLLIEKGANVNVKLFDSVPIAFGRLSKSDIEIFNLLLDKGLDINIRNHRNETLLMYACYDCNYSMEIIEKILTLNPDLINAKDDSDKNALIYACKIGYLKLINYLIEKGADIHVKNKKNRSALSYAVKHGYFEIAKILIEKGVDTSIVDIKNRTLLDISKKGYNSPLVNELLAL